MSVLLKQGVDTRDSTVPRVLQIFQGQTPKERTNTNLYSKDFLQLAFLNNLIRKQIKKKRNLLVLGFCQPIAISSASFLSAQNLRCVFFFGRSYNNSSCDQKMV